jgi:hypothetical protein
MKRILLFAAVGWILTASVGSATTVTFTNDTWGFKANGFVSVDSPLAAFSATMGADLYITDFAYQSHGEALAVWADYAGRLRIDFGEAMQSLQLAFGNDDPQGSQSGDRAWLQVFSGTTLVGTAYTVMNRDDIMNQIVGFSGAPFDTALFWYGDASGNSINLTEVVDDISFDSAVPEPASLLLLGTGLIGVVRAVRRKRS